MEATLGFIIRYHVFGCDDVIANHISDHDVIFAVVSVGHPSVSYRAFVAARDVIHDSVPCSD